MSRKSVSFLRRLFALWRELEAVAMVLAVSLSCGCHVVSVRAPQARRSPIAPAPTPVQVLAVPVQSPVIMAVVGDAIAQTTYTTGYDPSYVKIKYPGGDVAPETGVCADVIVRAFRKGGIDLQKEIHEDMLRAFSAYPRTWGLSAPDANIDHRRVPNLMTWFSRRGAALPLTTSAGDYIPGDVVAWELGGQHPHIGIVSNLLTAPGGPCLLVHNIGAGARLENVLFAWPIIGHYRPFSNAL